MNPLPKNPIEQEYPWDKAPYQTIKKAIFGERKSVMFFEDGGVARFKNDDVTPRQYMGILKWKEATVADSRFEFNIPTTNGAVLVLPWLTIRLATTHKFSDYWDKQIDDIEKGD